MIQIENIYDICFILLHMPLTTPVYVIKLLHLATFAVDSADICKKVVTFSVLTFTGVLTFSGDTTVSTA